MTANKVEMLPLPRPQVPFIDCDPSLMDIRRLARWYEQGATEHARAVAEHNVKARDAEIEALRVDRDSYYQQSKHNLALADRLAEALRLAEAALADIGDADLKPDDDVAWCKRRATDALPFIRAAFKVQGGLGDE